MFSSVKNGSSNSSSAVNNLFSPRTVSRFDWAKIYNQEGTSGHTVVQSDTVAPVATVNMQSTRSTGNLDQLGRSVEDMDLNARTATSTPDMYGGFQDTGVHPRGANVPSPPHSPIHVRIPSPERAMIIDPQMEDDVFGGAVVPEPQQPIQHQPEVAVALPVIPPVATAIVINTEPTPRADRLTEPVTPQNAQGLYKPDSLLFVANLSVGRPDEELAAIVHEAFTIFGSNFVKVRRDRHNNPFALVQFDNIDNSQKALVGSQNMVIGGRKVRVEEAEARRSVILYKLDGTAPSYQEVHRVLGGYGHIEEVKPTTHADAAQFGLPNGCWVKFSFYLDYKDLLNFFNDYNGEYLIMDAPNPDAPPRGPVVDTTGYGFYGPNVPLSPTDTRSVFVGSLPFNVTESELGNLFGQFGIVRLVNIIRKSVAGQGFNTFAFVEFSNVHEATAATQAEVDLRGRRIRVEPKQYSTRRPFRAYRQLAPSQGNRPAPWGPPAQSPQQRMPYGFQPMMGNQGYGPVVPYNGGASWNTPPPSVYQPRGFPPEDRFLNGSPHTPGQTVGPYGPPYHTPSHGPHGPQAYGNPPVYSGPSAYGGASAQGGAPLIPQGPRSQMGQTAHMGSRAPRRGVNTRGNNFGPQQQQ